MKIFQHKCLLHNSFVKQKFPDLSTVVYIMAQSQCLTPSFRQQLPNRCCSHLREESSSMDSTEVREVAIKVEFLCHHNSVGQYKKMHYDYCYPKYHDYNDYCQ